LGFCPGRRWHMDHHSGSTAGGTPSSFVSSRSVRPAEQGPKDSHGIEDTAQP
jgi:hypothetical protein